MRPINVAASRATQAPASVKQSQVQPNPDFSTFIPTNGFPGEGADFLFGKTDDGKFVVRLTTFGQEGFSRTVEIRDVETGKWSAEMLSFGQQAELDGALERFLSQNPNSPVAPEIRRALGMSIEG